MLLYHLTDRDNHASIDEKGLIATLKYSDTKSMGEAVQQFVDHPNYIDRNNCLFFRVFEPFVMDDDQIIVTVDSDTLDPANLFVCNESLADKIHRLRPHSAKHYLDTLIPFVTYVEHMRAYNDEFEHLEVLHIGDIPRGNIDIHL